MAALSGEPASKPFIPGPQPDAAPVGGTRPLDGRGFEEFRAVCECHLHHAIGRLLGAGPHRKFARAWLAFNVGITFIS